jgi:MFS family permease
MVVGVVVWGLGVSLGFPVGMSAAGDDPNGAAARVSAVATIAYCAFLVGPPVLGLVGHQVGILNSLWIVFALIVLAAVGIPAARERQQSRLAGADRARTDNQAGPTAL